MHPLIDLNLHLTSESEVKLKWAVSCYWLIDSNWPVNNRFGYWLFIPIVEIIDPELITAVNAPSD